MEPGFDLPPRSSDTSSDKIKSEIPKPKVIAKRSHRSSQRSLPRRLLSIRMLQAKAQPTPQMAASGNLSETFVKPRLISPQNASPNTFTVFYAVAIWMNSESLLYRNRDLLRNHRGIMWQVYLVRENQLQGMLSRRESDLGFGLSFSKMDDRFGSS